MDEVIINGIFFLLFLATGIASCILKGRIDNSFKKLGELDINKKDTKEYPVFSSLNYIDNFNITSIILYFASSMIFLYYFIKSLKTLINM